MLIPNHPPIEIVCNQAIAKKEFSNLIRISFQFPTDTSFNKIFSRVKSIIISKLKVDPSNVKLNAALENDLGADSLDEVELIMEYEKEFNIAVPDEDLCKLTTVKDTVLYIQHSVINKSRNSKKITS